MLVDVTRMRNLAGQFRLPVLDHMRLTRLQEESFVLLGFEEAHQRRTSDVFPQVESVSSVF